MDEIVLLTEREKWFAEDPRRTKALEFTLKGEPQIRIAEALGVHYQTIKNWTKHKYMLEALQERATDVVGAVPTRRLHQFSTLADHAYKNTAALMKQVAEDPKKAQDESLQKSIRRWGEDFRAYAEKERESLGLTVTKHVHHTVGGMIPGGSPVSPQSALPSLKTFLQTSLPALPPLPVQQAGDVASAVAEITRSALLENEEILEILYQEDIANEGKP